MPRGLLHQFMLSAASWHCRYDSSQKSDGQVPAAVGDNVRFLPKADIRVTQSAALPNL